MKITLTDPGVVNAANLTVDELNYIAACALAGVRAAYGKDEVFFAGQEKGGSLVGGNLTLIRPLTATADDVKTLEDSMEGVSLKDFSPIAPGRELKDKNIVAVVGKAIEEWIGTATVDGKKIFMIWSPKKTSFCLVQRSDPGSRTIPVAFPAWTATP